MLKDIFKFLRNLLLTAVAVTTYFLDCLAYGVKRSAFCNIAVTEEPEAEGTILSLRAYECLPSSLAVFSQKSLFDVTGPSLCIYKKLLF